jgi:arylsulfatase A-like enzyme
VGGQPANVLWISTDHHAWAHHRELAGGLPRAAVHDRIAAEGVNFTRAYTSCPLCSPARASMLTGVYPHRHGIVRNFGRGGAREDFRRGERLLPDLLSSAGYRCGYFGKWHCGERRSAADCGFEGISPLGYGYPYALPEYREYLDRKRLPRPTARVEWGLSAEDPAGSSIDLCARDSWFEMEGGSALLESPVETHEAFFVADGAERWMRDRAARGERFFLRVDPWGPHPPYTVAEPFAGSVDPDELPEYPGSSSNLDHRPAHHRDYLGEWKVKSGLDEHGWRGQLARCMEHVALVDAAMGGLLAALEDCGMAQDTLVIYTSDHGDVIGTNGGMANKGALLVEENVRVPLAVRWPGRCATGRTNSSPVSNLDLFSTVLEAAGLPPVGDADSVSLLPILEGREDAVRERLMVESHGMGAPVFQRALLEGRWKYVAQSDGFEELYDLEADPFEMSNLALSGHSPELVGARSGLRGEMLSSSDRAPEALEMLERPEARR